MPLFSKKLFNEIGSSDTVFEWCFRPKDGFLRYLGQIEQYLGRYDKNNTKGTKFSIPFYSNRDHSIVVRFPGIVTLGTIGINIGLYGAVSFTKLYAKYDKISLLYFILSNIFFAGMNGAGIIYHCILPNNHDKRYIFRYLDQVCTGIAGIFMGFGLKSIHQEINSKNVVLQLNDENTVDSNDNNRNRWDTEKYNVFQVVGASILLPMIHPIFGDIIYVGGLLSSVYNVIQCNLKLRQYDDDESDQELKNLKRMAKTVLFASTIAGVGILKGTAITSLTNGKINVMRTMFMFSDIGYMFTIYYGMKHYNNYS